MLRSAQVVPVAIASIQHGLAKQVSVVPEFAQSPQLTCMPTGLSNLKTTTQQPIAAQPDQQCTQHPSTSTRSVRIRRRPKPFTQAYSDRPYRPPKAKKPRTTPRATPTWRVAYIKDRATTATGAFLYGVLWRTKQHGRHPKTWEPRQLLVEDGFDDTLAIVDEWVEAGRKEDFFHFVSEKQDLSRGLPWRIFRAFISKVVKSGSKLSLVDIDFNRHCTGHRGVSAIERLNLEDGYVLIAASNTMAVGHAFVLHVAGAKWTVYDDNIKRALKTYGEWIDRLMFVRKITLNI
ncbi:unnamed protein product [Phytophthora lilii]|uniref:Unnamed protein product n=1 Tax=Phytophthora lilii TaxID=2077276 RepID=A0A9W6YK78_9STRA|nr:unnamed protein product [Phytophthora lilii]